MPRLTKFNHETNQYECIEKAKTQAEYNEQRKAVIQKLGKFEDKASEVAEEIFAELELKAPFFCENQIAYDHFNEELAELKKKYTEGEKENG